MSPSPPSPSSPDPFLLITRETSIDTTGNLFAAPFHPSRGEPLTHLTRAYPLTVLSLLDLATTSYFVRSNLIDAVQSPGKRRQLLNVLCAGYVRGAVVLVCSSVRRWRTSTPWLAAVGVMTGCVVVWALNWLVQYRRHAHGGVVSKGGWLALLASVSFSLDRGMTTHNPSIQSTTASFPSVCRIRKYPPSHRSQRTTK
jgi:hypothetical protein